MFRQYSFEIFSSQLISENKLEITIHCPVSYAKSQVFPTILILMKIGWQVALFHSSSGIPQLGIVLELPPKSSMPLWLGLGKYCKV
jgi:hypothetical protein